MATRFRRQCLPTPAVLGSLAFLACAMAASPVAAQSESPTGGGTGCVSNGNCQGTLYKDRANLDRWWYKFCSNCHTVSAPPPANTVTVPTTFQKELAASKAKFYLMHDMTLTDPVLKALVPKARLRDPAQVPSPWKELLKR